MLRPETIEVETSIGFWPPPVWTAIGGAIHPASSQIDPSLNQAGDVESHVGALVKKEIEVGALPSTHFDCLTILRRPGGARGAFLLEVGWQCLYRQQ